MTVQECITSGETLESKAKKTKTKQNKNPQNKTLRSIELVKKKKSIETVFHLGDTPSACLTACLAIEAVWGVSFSATQSLCGKKATMPAII